MGKENYLQARDEYIELIKQELLGPGSEVSIPDKEHELITNAPDIRYSIGILFPKNNKLNADSDDVARVEVEESVEALEDNAASRAMAPVGIASTSSSGPPSP